MAKVEKSPLAFALDHVFLAASGPANYAQYCRFDVGGWLVGYDGIVAAGCKVVEHLQSAPHTETLRHAVVRAGSPYSMTEREGSVTVRGHKVKADVPTFPLTAIPNVLPDLPRCAFTAEAREVCCSVGKLAVTKAETIIASSVLLRANSVIATDGGTVVEGWHGGDLPGRWQLPREFIDAMAKCKLMPTSCGWSDETFTVWYAETAWLRANLYVDKYPDTDIYFAKMISECTELRPIPKTLLIAIDTLKPFRSGPMVTITSTGLNTEQDCSGASFAFEHHLTSRSPYPTDALRIAAEHGEWMAFGPTGAFWYGQKLRGITALSASDVF